VARIVLDQVSKTFIGPRVRQIQAVQNLSLEVEDGELLVLAGPSGCGKTTTLRLIAGLERASTGTISIDGKIVNDVSARDRDVAMVFQSLALYPHMTGYENMAFGLKARRQEGAEISQRIEDAAAILDLADCLDRRPNELSGGQRQRVALGRAIVLRPKVLLLDEPLSNLDAPLRARMRAELASLHPKLGVTLVYVTHDQVDAMSLGERIALMDAGQLQQVADPMVVYREPANLFVAGFFGSPPMNFFRGKVIWREQDLWFEEDVGLTGNQRTRAPLFSVAIPQGMRSGLSRLVEKVMVMGIRPENVEIAREKGVGTVEAKLERVERLGADIYLHGRTAVHALAIRGRGEVGGTGDVIRVRFDMREARFFDAVDGKRL
jgi:multiple sugar transport system ATP-binding protein